MQKNKFNEQITPYIDKIENKTITKDDINTLIILFEPTIKKHAAMFCASKSPYYFDYEHKGRMALYKAIQCYDKAREASFYTFASTCINNAMKDLARKMASNNSRLVSLDTALIAAPEEPNSIDYFALLKKIRKNLTDYQYKVFLMHVEEYSYEEIAKEVNKSKKDIDNCIQQIKKKLKSIL